ncbi:MAG: cysteine synthase A [Thiohalomonadaceae bacterium]
MRSVFDDNSLSIGSTPLVRLNRVVPPGARILAKIEGRNPAFSVKDRIGAAMVWDAQERGLLSPGKELIEATSGNTGIALAFVAAARGIPVTLTMPETMSLERRKVLSAFGATLILTPGAKGMAGAIARAEAIMAQDPDRYFMPGQFTNPVNPEIHVRTTGREIWEATDGNVDVLVAGVGTGGTITGISRYFEQIQGKPLHSVAVEPADSQVIGPTLAGKPPMPGRHVIQGIGAGFVPPNLDLTLVDQVETATNEEAIRFTLRLVREEGILCGMSSGAAAAVACRLAARPQFAGKSFVVILPDAGERYLSSVLFADITPPDAVEPF